MISGLVVLFHFSCCNVIHLYSLIIRPNTLLHPKNDTDGEWDELSNDDIIKCVQSLKKAGFMSICCATTSHRLNFLTESFF